MSANLFLGLVTHPRTQYPDAAGSQGLVRQLADALHAQGISTTCHIIDEDLYTGDVLAIKRDEVVASIKAELSVEEQWRAYLKGADRGSPLALLMRLRYAYRRLRYAPPWRSATNSDDSGYRMLRRLINIELAHLDLMRKAIASGAEWALLVEDDAYTHDPLTFASDMSRFMKAAAASEQPRYVNVSRSFSEKHLGVAAHLTAIGTWGTTNDGGQKLLSADRPVTNTVCAILYRATFLADLVAEFDSIPLSPVIPIDWKLNKAILQMHERGALGSGDCWVVSPAPLVQRSMMP